MYNMHTSMGVSENGVFRNGIFGRENEQKKQTFTQYTNMYEYTI